MEAMLWFEMATSSLLCWDPETDVSSGHSCQGVDGVQGRMELQTGTEVQLPHIPPGSCVLANEGAILIKRYLRPFAVVHQTVVAVRSRHDGLGGGLAPLKTLFLLTYKSTEGETSDSGEWEDDMKFGNVLVHTGEGRAKWRYELSCNLKSFQDIYLLLSLLLLFTNHIQ